MGSTVQPLCHGKALEACARLVDNDCPDYQIVHRAFLRSQEMLSQSIVGNTDNGWTDKNKNQFLYSGGNGMVKNVMCELQMAVKESKKSKNTEREKAGEDEFLAKQQSSSDPKQNHCIP
ncbi:hypothetical protein TURU_052315 [Turdus rufiventris]|nr:hypothetical protein TURU_052315 [Turdus rufiventris]